MVGVSLVGSVRATGQSPLSKWSQTISGWSLPDRFAFFVFHIRLDYCAENFFPGLDVQMVEDGYYVGGTLDKWDRACYASLSKDMSPEDCREIYRQVYTTITGQGYTMSGKRNTSNRRFTLK